MTTLATEPQRLADLLPQIQTTAPSSQDASPIWTDEARAAARAANTQRHLDHGWQAGKTSGVLEHGEGRAKVETRVTALMPSRYGEPDFNPLLDAFAAIQLGAELEGPNRYRFLGGMLLDANGACRDESECPECGSTPPGFDDRGLPIGNEYRFQVKDGKGGWTYCRLCVTEQELGDIRQQKAAAQSRAGGRR